MEFPLMAGTLVRQQELDLLEPLTEALVRLIGRNAKPAKLRQQEGARKSDIQPSAGNGIEHRDLAGELERMIEYREHRTGNEAHAARALRNRSEEHDRIRRVAAVAREIMLDCTRMGKAQRFCFLGNRERL